MTYGQGRDARKVFSQYVRQKYNAEMFDLLTPELPENERIFALSLASFQHLVKNSLDIENKAGSKFRIYPAFVENPIPNAFASLEQGVHLCGIHGGLASALLGLCLYCFAQKDFFTEAGNVSMEISPQLPDGTNPLYHLLDFVAEHGNDSLPEYEKTAIRPLHTDRLNMAVYMFHLMMRFAWFHEHYHCVNGHIGFLKTIQKSAHLNEMPEDGDNNSAELVGQQLADIDMAIHTIHHCMELDADRAAFWACATIQTNGMENIEAIAALPLKLRMKLVLFSCMLLSYVFSESHKRSGSASLQTHPPPYIRLHNMIRTLATNIHDAYPAIQPAFDEVLSEFTNLRRGIPELFSSARIREDMRNQAFQDTITKADDDLDTLRKKLAQFEFRQR